MREKPEVLDSKLVHSGWLNVRVDTLRVAGRDEPYDYEVVSVGDGGVAVLPFVSDDELLLARQYRHPVGEQLLELIQGGMKRGEQMLCAAERELMEETGYSAKLEKMCTMYPLPGMLTTRLHILKATEMKKVREPDFEPLESMELVRMPYRQVLDEVLSGKHHDSALGWAVLFYESSRRC